MLSRHPEAIKSRKRRKQNPQQHAHYCKAWRESAAGKKWKRAHPHTAEQSRRERRQYPNMNKTACRRWYKKHRQTYLKQLSQRLKTDPPFALIHRTRDRINSALKRVLAQKSAPTITLLGCSIPDFIQYLEKLFQPGMTWGNRRLWHIDHKKPLSSFDLTQPEQQLAAFHYTNCQPLWAKVNLAKGVKI